MISGITCMGWFHTIVGIPAILVGLYLLFNDRFIFINTGLANSIEDPLVQNFYMSYVVIFGIFSVYQIIKISKGEMNEI